MFYYIIYGLFYLVSLLPFWLLYGISDAIAFLLEKVIKYRSEVLDKNLLIAFPEKSEKELQFIKHKYYHRLCDNFIETIKLISISKASLHKRFKTVNPEVMTDLAAKGKDVTGLLGHFFNWEYANQSYALSIPQTLLVVYMPISNKIFDRLFIQLRSRFNTKLIAATKYSQEIKQYQNERKALILVGDQNPGVKERSFWTTFFGRMSPFVNGPEKTARYGHNAVVFCHIRATEKRGYYESTIELITENARDTEKGEITKKMRDLIEADVQAQPWNYLWSHNRFRHEFEPDRFQHLVI